MELEGEVGKERLVAVGFAQVFDPEQIVSYMQALVDLGDQHLRGARRDTLFQIRELALAALFVLFECLGL